MKKHYRHEKDCLNCGTVLEGKFCHNCGQENLQIKENFGHMMNHAISDYFHFDHQFFHTLKPLLFKPGKLTNEYMAGKRTQYLHPVKMYIFISLIFFILYFRHTEGAEGPNIIDYGVPKKESVDSARQAIDKNPNLDDATKKQLKEYVAMGIPVKINASKSKTKGVNLDDDDDDDFDFSSKSFNNTEYPTYEKYLEAQQKLPANKRDGYFVKLFHKKNFDYKRHGGNPGEVLMEEVKHNVPKMMFVLLPLFALILRLSFWENKKYYVEHLIFSFHLHCFLFLFIATVILAHLCVPEDGLLWNLINFAAFICMVLYIYKALRAVYHRSRFRTITKMLGISLTYTMVFGLCLTIVFFISAMTAA